MTTTNNPTGESFSVRHLWEDTPTAFKGGVVLAVIGWFVSISTSQYSTTNGVLTSCSYLDFFKVGAGAVLVVLAVVGFVGNSRNRRHRLPTVLAAVLAGALLVVGVLLALRGLAVYPSCAAQIDVG